GGKRSDVMSRIRNRPSWGVPPASGLLWLSNGTPRSCARALVHRPAQSVDAFRARTVPAGPAEAAGVQRLEKLLTKGQAGEAEDLRHQHLLVEDELVVVHDEQPAGIEPLDQIQGLT